MKTNLLGFSLLEKELFDLEKSGLSFLSLTMFLEKYHLFVTKHDIKALRTLLKNNKKWKIVKVTEYQFQRRGRKK